MNRLFFTLIAVCIVASLKAQTDTTAKVKRWSYGGNTGLSLTQTSLTNWAAGGENSLATNAYLSLFANYKKGKGAWDNTLDLAYGILKQGEQDVRKSDDKIDLASKYGYQASEKWYYTALLSFKSQFTDGFKYPDDSTVISRFLAPAYILGSVGMDFKPNDNFTAFISPLTAKLTIVNDARLSEAGAYGVDQGEKIRAEIGGYAKIAFKKDLMENVNFQTKADFFSNYANNPGNIDINWEILVAMKVNKYITANINTQLIYDDDINIAQPDGSAGPRVQFKEIFGVGLAYKF